MGNRDTHNMLKAPKRIHRAGGRAQRLLASVLACLLIASALPAVDRSAVADEPKGTEYTNLVVQKKWVGPATVDSVKYHLEAYDRASGAKVDIPSSVAGLSGTVTKDGNWRAEVANLPAKVGGADVDYKVVEDDVPTGYDVHYSESSDFMNVNSYWVDLTLKFQLSKSIDKELSVKYQYGDDEPEVVSVPRDKYSAGQVVECTVRHYTSLPLGGEPKEVEVLSVTTDNGKNAVAENITIDEGSYARVAPASKKGTLAFTPKADINEGDRVQITYSYKGEERSFVLDSKKHEKWAKNKEATVDIPDYSFDADASADDLKFVKIEKVKGDGSVDRAYSATAGTSQLTDIPEHVEAYLVFTSSGDINADKGVKFTYTYNGQEYAYTVGKGQHDRWSAGEQVKLPLPDDTGLDPNNLGTPHLTKIEVLKDEKGNVERTYQETVVDKGSISELTTEVAGTTTTEVKALVMTNLPDHAFVLSKTIKGPKTVNLDKTFRFQVTITGADGNELPGEFDYRGYASVEKQTSPGDGKIKSGDTINLAHGQGIFVLKLSDDTAVSVTELDVPKEFSPSVNGVDGVTFEGTITQENPSLIADYANKQSDPWEPAYPDDAQDKVSVTKKIESLCKEDPFEDTTLTGDDFYRLYLDVTGAQDSRGYDFLFIVDTTSSMTEVFGGGSNQSSGWQDATDRRFYTLDKILNGEHKTMTGDGLVSQILSANPNNRVAVGSFSGSTNGKTWNLEGEDPNADNYARILLDWTSNPAYVNVYGDMRSGTNYGAGLIKASKLLDDSRSSGNKKIVIFMSDGTPYSYFADYNGGTQVAPGEGTYVKGMSGKDHSLDCDFARFKAQCADLFGSNYTKNLDFYTVGIGNDDMFRLKDMTNDWVAMGGASAYYPGTNADELIEGYNEIISKYLVSNVLISDSLSQWVELYQEQADVKIGCTHYNEAGTATNTEVVWSGSCADGAITGSWCGTAANGNGDNVIDSVTFTPSADVAAANSTGTIDVTFKPEYKLGNVTYTLSFNVKVTDAAKNHEGAMPDTGDLNTDKRTDMKTSSGQPGFFSNNGASAKYKMGSESKDRAYPKPVVQAVPTIKNLDWSFYKVDEKDNPIEGAEFSLYRCGNAKPDHAHSPSVTVDSDCCWTAADTSTVVSAKSDSTGLVSFTDLQSGDYVLVETKTKGGYQLPAGQWRLTIDAAQGTVSDPQATEGTELPPAFKKGRIGGDSSAPGSEEVLMLPNYPSHDLPFTGIKIPLWALIIGTLLVTAAAGWLAKKNHQDRATRQGDF